MRCRILLLFLLVPAPYQGQRVIVNRRARQRQPISEVETQDTESISDRSYSDAAAFSGLRSVRTEVTPAPVSDFRLAAEQAYSSPRGRVRYGTLDRSPAVADSAYDDGGQTPSAVRDTAVSSSSSYGQRRRRIDVPRAGSSDYYGQSGESFGEPADSGSSNEAAAYDALTSGSGERSSSASGRTRLRSRFRENVRGSVRSESSSELRETETAAVSASSGGSSAQYSRRQRSRSRLPVRPTATEGSTYNRIEEEPRKKETTRLRTRLRSRVGTESASTSSGSRSEYSRDFTSSSRDYNRDLTPAREYSRDFSSSREYSREAAALRDFRDRGSGLRSSSRGQELGRETRRIDSSHEQTSSKQYGAVKVKFPRKNLIPGLPRVTYSEKNQYEDDFSSRSNNIIRGDIKPTKTRTEYANIEAEPIPNVDYENTEIQSTRDDNGDVIIVTHQVATQTVFTLLESKTVRSLYVDTFTPSMEIIAISDLKSTYIDESPVIYAHSQTKFDLGVQETLFDAILPTRTTVLLDKTDYSLDRNGELVTTSLSTIYNIQTITHREPVSASAISPDINSLGTIIQNVILGLLGGNILGIGGAGAGGPVQTRYVTHTRSFLTTNTLETTALVPITLRGSEVVTAVTETVTQVSTSTDYSIETLLEPGLGLATSQPFLPLAPALHRATRVVPSAPGLPLILPSPNLHDAGVIETEITKVSTTVTTLTSDITSDIVVTLGGREVQTEYVQPTTQVLTLTSYATQTVTLAQPAQPSLDRVGLLRAILKLNGQAAA